MTPQLVLRMSGGATRVWALSSHPLSLGRGEQCTLRVHDPLVSRLHCELWVEGGNVFVRDLVSSNDTLVNGEPVSDTRRLHPGDTLAVGDTTFELREDIIPPENGDTTATLRAAIMEQYGSAALDGHVDATPKTVRELYQLYTLSKKLATVNALEELSANVWQYAESAIGADFIDLGILVSGGSKNALAPRFQFPETSSYAIDDSALERALENRAVVRFEIFSASGAKAHCACVPVLHRDDLIGVLTVGRCTRTGELANSELGLFQAAAELAAPHIRAVERAAQRARDEDRLRLMAGVSQGLIGDSPAMHATRETISRVAPSPLHVLVLGETGTGKELAARAIHEQSARAHGPFVVVNCAAIPEELFESQMFGHEPGSFTGAGGRHYGYLEEASGGTLFLDEIGELSPSNQARLLRAVEGGTLRRVGGTGDISVDVRYVSATNRDFHGAEVDRFREDLYFRLCGVLVQMPPLRDRPEDIRPLAAHFLGLDPNGGGRTAQLDPSAWDLLASHPWPGNVRELRQVIERLSLFHRNNIVDAEDLQHMLLPSRRALPLRPEQPVQDFPPTAPLEEIERHHVDRAVRHHQGNLSAAAKSLGINRITLYRRLKRYEGTDGNA